KFEIPLEMRHVAEQSIEQAKRAFDGFKGAAWKAVTAFEEQTTAAHAGAWDMGRKAMEFAEQNVATSFEFAQDLLRAKDIQEVMRLQSEYVKAQIEAFAEQAKELGESAKKMAVDATRPKS